MTGKEHCCRGQPKTGILSANLKNKGEMWGAGVATAPRWRPGLLPSLMTGTWLPHIPQDGHVPWAALRRCTTTDDVTNVVLSQWTVPTWTGVMGSGWEGIKGEGLERSGHSFSYTFVKFLNKLPWEGRRFHRFFSAGRRRYRQGTWR